MCVIYIILYWERIQDEDISKYRDEIDRQKLEILGLTERLNNKDLDIERSVQEHRRAVNELKNRLKDLNAETSRSIQNISQQNASDIGRLTQQYDSEVNIHNCKIEINIVFYSSRFNNSS